MRSAYLRLRLAKGARSRGTTVDLELLGVPAKESPMKRLKLNKQTLKALARQDLEVAKGASGAAPSQASGKSVGPGKVTGC